MSWTTKIEQALRSEGAKDILVKVKEENGKYLEFLSKLVLSETNKILCQTYANLTLSQGYYEIILDELVSLRFIEQYIFINCV